MKKQRIVFIDYIRGFFTLLLVLPLISGCGSGAETPDYYIVGYFPSYNARADADKCWWDITHVNLSFVTINADGSINDGNVRRSYPQVAAKAKEHGVKMMVSLGGGGPKEEQDAFAAAILDDTARENIIKNVMALVKELGLAGVDIDYEAWNYPEDSVDQLVPALEKLFLGFRKALGKKGLLSSAVAIYGMDKGGYTKAIMESMDYMTIMAYDLTGWSGVMGPHSPFSYAVEGCEKALACGANPQQVVLGVPFYGRGWRDLDLSRMYGGNYAGIVERNPGAEFRNELTGETGKVEFWYDGFPAIDQKAQYIKKNGFRGFMFWELTGDSRAPEKSLVKHMNKVLGFPE